MNWIKVMGDDGRTYLLNVDNIVMMAQTIGDDKMDVWFLNGEVITMDAKFEGIEDAIVELSKRSRKPTEEEEYKESLEAMKILAQITNLEMKGKKES